MQATIDENALIHRRPLHDELADRLRGLIAEGELKAGAKIPERELCERFGVSRTPLREALKVLGNEGLVELTPNRGASVRPLTIEELENLFPVMGALEALAGELACRSVTEDELEFVRALHAGMVDHWQAGRRWEYFRANRAIHAAIVDATRNPVLRAHHRALSGRLTTARYMANMSKERWDQAVAEHEDILAALEARDGERLGRILKAHLEHKLATVRDWLAAREDAA